MTAQIKTKEQPNNGTQSVTTRVGDTGVELKQADKVTIIERKITAYKMVLYDAELDVDLANIVGNEDTLKQAKARYKELRIVLDRLQEKLVELGGVIEDD